MASTSVALLQPVASLISMSFLRYSLEVVDMYCCAAEFFMVMMSSWSACSRRSLKVSKGLESSGLVRLDMRLPLYARKQNNTEKDALPEFIMILRAWVLVQGSVYNQKKPKDALERSKATASWQERSNRIRSGKDGSFQGFIVPKFLILQTCWLES